MRKNLLLLIVSTLSLLGFTSCQETSYVGTYYCSVTSEVLTSEELDIVASELFTQGLVIGYGIDNAVFFTGAGLTEDQAIDDADGEASADFNKWTNSIDISKFQTLFPNGTTFYYNLHRVNSDATETPIDSRRVTIPKW